MSKEKKIKNMNSKMTKTHNYQQMNLKKRKTTKTKTKQTIRTGTESEKWTSHRGISMGRGKRGRGVKKYREEEA